MRKAESTKFRLFESRQLLAFRKIQRFANGGKVQRHLSIIMAGRRIEESLSSLGLDARKRFEMTIITLDGSPEEVKAQLEPAAVYSEYQRFLLWATNLGLFQRSHESLEYQVQDK